MKPNHRDLIVAYPLLEHFGASAGE